MMMPSSSSSSSATVRVEKATSEFLIGPDWTMNIEICDMITSNPGLAKDVVKTVKKRLQHKNPKVQLLSLTLLETMVKNCGDGVHFQIAERNLLQEMVKIVRKKADMHVRDKILTLLDSWQQAFGGPGGRHSQYYWAYDELRRVGVQFPHRSDAPPIFTPPASHPIQRHPQAGYGMASNSSTRLDEAMAAEMENLSFSSLNSMRNVLGLLADMLQAVNPSERMAVKDEVIIDLVDSCRSNQKKLMRMLPTTGDEELLGQGLELNDSLQSVLAKHDAIASGSLLPPTQAVDFKQQSAEVLNSNLGPNRVGESSPSLNSSPSAPVVALTTNLVEEEEDDFAQLARRHSKVHSAVSQSTSTGANGGATMVDVNSSSTSGPEPVPGNALALLDTPAPVKTSKEQDMIDFLSITLSSATTTSPRNPPTSSPSEQHMHQTTDLPTTQGHPFGDNEAQASFNSYVVPWAQPLPQPQPQPQPQRQLPMQNSRYSFGYPPPPWAATPGYYTNQGPPSSTPYTYSNQHNIATPDVSLQGTRPLHHGSSLPTRASNGSTVSGVAPHMGSNQMTSAPPAGPKPFIPSYRLFEDLNVLGSPDGRYKMTTNASLNMSGTSSRSMVGGRK